MIKTGGENVAAAEVEQVANEHPAILESAAVGVPDDIRDEQVHLYVVARSGASVDVQNLIDHCTARLAKFKVPKVVHVVPELPRTAVGKVQKHRLGNPLASDSA
jgi:crotonobetaine/carnitine-CoA ligase